jgi:outer membrane protein OmpA-like peptidoglycan-associated protein
MLIFPTSLADAGRTAEQLGRGILFVLGLTGALLAGCARQPVPELQAAPPAAAVASPPRTAQPFDAAVAGLADALIAKAEPGEPRVVVIDPLIDRASSAETTTTRSIGAALARRIRSQHPQFEVRPFTTASLSEQPLIMLGSIAGVAEAGSVAPATGKPQVYRIWAVLADLRNNLVLGREMVWVRADEINPTPTTFFRDSPVSAPDVVTTAYLKTCSSTAGTPIDPTYLQALRAQALVADAIADYEGSRYEEALARYDEALRLPGGEQLRILNGIYLADWALGRRQAAEDAFGRVVDYGLAQDRLAVKLLFRPGSTAFWPDPTVSGPYPMWLRQIAAKADERGSCLAVNGHTSTTGSAAANEKLSLARAERVRQRLVAQRPTLRDRTQAEGFGDRQPIIGTGTDDSADALDRRVEFQPRSCPEASAGNEGAAFRGS